ncbi:MAG: hypothetical protein GXP25_23080, partial [Planctomycetes bacterium]|nr:hypothetical protein [Planctomycetota bacterium]
YSGLWKVVARVYEDEPKTELFESSSDPDELTNVADAHPDVVAELSNCLRPAIESPYFFNDLEDRDA